MKGFFACPPDAWAIAAEALPKPWPEVCAAADLRWWVDQIGGGKARTLPTVRELMARWGWTRWRASELVKHVEAWADPLRLDASRAAVAVAAGRAPDRDRTGTGQGPDRDRTGTGRGDTGERRQSAFCSGRPYLAHTRR